ncbi:alpha/beta fold hydrolase [Streptomyces chromofuscus]|uniref:Alpha/beta hydrolase n=1 Tax=Streptomyces chromofuscus TaxID=42881 RepID=A0A7M2T967_STRCW|nr:alpha/beta hydrolase [Streptomyces chromofuscus]QOV45200.1 alpha/beta hydrolase [Streptomyces chromofuscus]GGS99579.1 hydrolase [Streptomyces chromofuscus]
MKHSYQPQTLPRATDDPSSPLSPGTHTIAVPHGPVRVEQRYHVAGSGPVCIAHSGGPGIGWEYLRMLGLEDCLTMVYVEPVGTGDSGRLPDRRDYTVATYARLLHGVVEHLGLPKVTLLGHSHGGFVAQQYALDHPGRLAALVLYDTSPVADEQFWSAAVAAMERFVADRVNDHSEVAGYVAALTTRLDQLDDEGTTAVLRTMMPAYLFDYWGREEEFAPARQSLRMYAAPTGGQGAPFDVRAELPGITTPTLVLAGEQDFICGPRWARLLHEGLPAADVSIIEDTGHLAHIERPARFSASVLAFLRAHDVLEGQRLS